MMNMLNSAKITRTAYSRCFRFLCGRVGCGIVSRQRCFHRESREREPYVNRALFGFEPVVPDRHIYFQRNVQLHGGFHLLPDDVSLLLVNVDGEFYAIENLCSHDGGELSDGEVIGTEIICPRHDSRFCLKTGTVLSAPAFEDIDTYPVRIVGGRVQVFDEAK